MFYGCRVIASMRWSGPEDNEMSTRDGAHEENMLSALRAQGSESLLETWRRINASIPPNRRTDEMSEVDTEVERILAMTDEEVLAQAKVDGVNLEDVTRQHDIVVKNAALDAIKILHARLAASELAREKAERELAEARKDAAYAERVAIAHQKSAAKLETELAEVRAQRDENFQDAKVYSDAAKMWREQCEAARAQLSSQASSCREVARLREAAEMVREAWDFLPQGYYPAQTVSEWLWGPMKAAIDNIRAALTPASPPEAREG